MEDVHSGRLVQKQAAGTYGIPMSTLQLKLKGWKGHPKTETMSGGGERIKLIEKAVEMNIVILELPAHTSHLQQPLDVSVFRGIKSKWDEILPEWCRHHYRRLTKFDFADILEETWRYIGETQIKSGFKKSRIYDPGYEHCVNRSVTKADRYDPEKLQQYYQRI
ncbi:hypothetical protein PR048_019523 [Dryococelus australis]|uniref:Transposase n=1 Tax=Dryococelus australis TaxID=614101 RepID=A0ABQ9H3T2_9NEOP|nr:hypothetical protein PR048_019523 [Dryococelus australis]